MTKGLYGLDNLMGAASEVRSCKDLDGGYCLIKKKWCHSVKICDVKKPPKSRTKAKVVLMEQCDHTKAIKHFKTIWCTATYSGNILAIAYDKNKKHTCNIGTFNKLSDALIAQRDYCKENNTPFRNKHINIDDVIRFETTGALPE